MSSINVQLRVKPEWLALSRDVMKELGIEPQRLGEGPDSHENMADIIRNMVILALDSYIGPDFYLQTPSQESIEATSGRQSKSQSRAISPEDRREQIQEVKSRLRNSSQESSPPEAASELPHNQKISKTPEKLDIGPKSHNTVRRLLEALKSGDDIDAYIYSSVNRYRILALPIAWLDHGKLELSFLHFWHREDSQGLIKPRIPAEDLETEERVKKHLDENGNLKET